MLRVQLQLASDALAHVNLRLHMTVMESEA